MKVKLLMVGKTDTGWIGSGIGIYSSRLAHYVNFSMVEIPDIKNAASLSREAQKGKEYTSAGWAARLEDRITHFSGDMVFVIGGAYGFSEAVYARANEKMALSLMTFSHQMVRAIFLEQLYRAFTIIKGEPYHHE